MDKGLQLTDERPSARGRRGWRRLMTTVSFVLSGYLMLIAAAWSVLDAFDTVRSPNAASSVAWIAAALAAPIIALGLRQGLRRRNPTRATLGLLISLACGAVVAIAVFSVALGPIGVD